MKKLLNPRGYLSWTQVDLWLRNPELYVARYMLGEADEQNNRMAFGSKAGSAIETGKESGDALIDILAATITKYEKPEFEIRNIFKTKAGSVELLGKMDTFRPEPLAFREYKTGTTKWTQAMADKHKQLDHYASILWIARKGQIPQIHLDWAQTELIDGEVCLTGKVTTFEVKKTTADILKYLGLVSRVAIEIDARYRKELNILN